MSDTTILKKPTLKTFEELEVINFDDLAVWKIAPGKIFFITKKKHPVGVLSAGEIIEFSFARELNGRGVNEFCIDWFIDPKFVQGKREMLQNMKRDIPESLAARENFVEWFSATYWGEKQCNLLDLVLMMTTEFYALPAELINDMGENGVILLNRSFLIASLSVSISIIEGNVDYAFLKDMFNACLLIDLGLFSSKFTYNMLMALEKEQVGRGDGKTSLENMEQDWFVSHPEAGQRMLEEGTSISLEFPEMFNLVGSHHGDLENDGDTGKLMNHEKVVFLLDKVVPVVNFEYITGDGAGYLKKVLSKLVDKLPEAQELQLRIDQNLKRTG